MLAAYVKNFAAYLKEEQLITQQCAATHNLGNPSMATNLPV